MNISPFDFQLQFTFATDAMAELDRKLALLYSTREGTMPLDREFGINMDFVDMPPEAAKSLYTAEVTEKVAKFIPTVRVQEVAWGAGAQGNLIAKDGPVYPGGAGAVRPMDPWRRGRILSQGGDHKCLTCQQSRTHRKSALLTIRRWRMCGAKWWPIMRTI